MTLRFVSVSQDDRQEYETAFDELYQAASDIEPRLYIHAIYMEELEIRKLVAIVRCFFV